MAFELGTAYVTVAASTKGVASKIAKDFGDAGQKAGGVFGSAFGSGAKAAVSSVDEQREALRKVQAQVDANAESVKRARKVEEDAARAARIAEQKLAEAREPKRSAALERAEKKLADLRKNGGASAEDLADAEKAVKRERDAGQPKASAILAAEDRLTRARDKQREATAKARSAEAELTSHRGKLEKVTKDLERSQDTAEKGLLGRLKGRARNLFPAAAVSADARRVGKLSGADLADSFTKQAKKDVDRQSKGIFSGLRGGGALVMGAAAGVAGAAVGAAGNALSGAGSWLGGSADAAAELEQSIGAIDSIFKTSAGNMHTWAKGAAEAVGLSRDEYNKLATVMGAQLKNGGTSIDQLGKKTNDLIGVGADLSSMFGGTTADAVGAISSALKGERDPIEKYGVSLKQAGIDAEAAALGFKKGADGFSNQAQQAATLSLIMKQTKDATGNFAKEADTAAHKSQVLAARQEDLKTKVGELLMPLKTAATDTGLKFVGWVEDMLPTLDRWGDKLGNLKDDLGGVASILFKGDFKGADGTFGLEEDSKGVDLLFDVRDAALGVQGVLTTLFTGKFLGASKTLGFEEDSGFVDGLFRIREGAADLMKWVRGEVLPRVKGVIGAFVGFWQTAGRIVGEFVAGMMGRLRPLWPQIKDIFEQIKGIVVGALDLVKAYFQRVTGIIQGIWDRWGNQIMGTVTWIFKLVVGIVQAALKMIRGIIQVVTGIISGDWSKVWAGIKTVFSGIWDAIKAILSSAWDAIKGIWETTTSWVSRKWGELWDGVQSKASSVLESVRSKIETITGKFAGYFDTAVSGIRKAWDAVQEAAAKPVNFVIETVLNNGIIKAFNKVAETFKVDKRIPNLDPIRWGSTPPSATSGGGARPQQKLATGGIVMPGYTPGRDVHEFYSPTAGRLSLSGGEPVMRPEFGRLLGGERAISLLNRAARKGKGALLAAFDAIGHQSLATGGTVSLRGHRFTDPFAKRLLLAEQMAGGTMQITQGGYRPTTSYSGTSHAKDAVDIAGAYHRFIAPLRSVGIPTWDRAGKGNWIAHAHGVPLPGAGTAGGSAVWQAQDYLRGGDGLGGRDNGPRVPVGASLDWSKIGDTLKLIGSSVKSVVLDLTERFAGPLKRLSELGASPYGSVVKGFATSTADTIKDKASNLLGFRDGGVSPGGWAALSEDGRPELVVGPQFQKLVAGSRVFSWDELSGRGGDVYVQNPFTGEYLLAQMAEVASDVVDDNLAAAGRRAFV